MEEEELPPFVIELARSSRSKCKSCRRAIDKGKPRFGLMIEGPFGAGYLWHHLTCAARQMLAQVEEAYELRAFEAGKDPVPESELPPIEELRKLEEKAKQKKEDKKPLPYADLAPTGRGKCKRCEEPFEKGTPRVFVGRAVEFGRQMRTAIVNVHPRCVAQELASNECTTESKGFADQLREHSGDLDAATLETILAEIGSLDA